MPIVVLLILPDVGVTESQSSQVSQRHRTATSDKDEQGDQLQRERAEEKKCIHFLKNVLKKNHQ